MLDIPVLRWGKPYDSMEKTEIRHFYTGEPVAKVSTAAGVMIGRDMRLAQKGRDALREIPPHELVAMMKKVGELYLNATLPLGNGTQSPDDFVKQQSSTTGLPEHMCRGNMTKNHFVLSNMDKILDCLTRGLDLNILTRGYGDEGRGVTVSYQCQAPALGMVLPSNSPGVHTLWLPVIPLQVGLLIKPGSTEPWTPYRMAAAMVEAGVPKEAIAIYPGGHDVGAAITTQAPRVMIFGSQKTIDQYKGNPGVQVHGPGFSKILLGDDVVDEWEKYLDLMVDSIFKNSGRGCINASSIWASRHTKEIAAAIAERIGPAGVKPPDDPEATIAAFVQKEVAVGVWGMLEQQLKESGVTHMTEKFGPRLVELDRCAYLLPTIAHATSPEPAIVRSEFMFPFATVVECPQDQMLSKIGYTLVGTAITNNRAWQKQLVDSTHIDRLNLGPVPTIKLDWLQPHEGNIVDFLYRARAMQVPAELPAGA